MADLITDEMLDHFAVVGTWDEVAAKLRERYTGVAARVVSYLGEDRSVPIPPSGTAGASWPGPYGGSVAAWVIPATSPPR